eukprot:m.44880 g.44880  ORF g.44880 m.44880 type:complete len:549 (+) comp15079_c0_seq2:30-1676(+)
MHSMSHRFPTMAGLRILVLATAATALKEAPTFSVPTVLSNDMILAAAPRQAMLWGTGSPGATVTATISGGRTGTFTTTTLADGTWLIALSPVQPTLTPSTVALTSSLDGDDVGTVQLLRVLFGDILICGGQSNMQFSLNLAFNGSAEIAAAGKYSKNLRLLTVDRVQSTSPRPNATLSQPWTISSPSAVNDNKSFGIFSAECYISGRMLLDLRPDVPIGLVSSCWSGSMIQPWMSPTALGMCPNAKAVGTGVPFSQSQMYNAMIHPLLNLAPAGVLWHQGEENSGNPVEYHCFFTAMINDWRAQFKMPTLPFVFVQLQPCGIPPAQRYAQAAALVLPNVAMAVAVDLQDAGPAHIAPCPGFNQTPACGNPNGMCHTRWKQDVASRLVAAAARLIFNSTQLAPVENTIPPLSPSIGDFVGMAAKDYRTYEVVFSADNVDPRLPSIGVGGTRECSLCCNPPSFAIEYTSDAPGEHWQALGTTPDKHGVPFTYNPRTGQMTFIVVVQPPWRPSKFRHAWSDAPQCILFASGEAGAMPFAPFNVTIPANHTM